MLTHRYLREHYDYFRGFLVSKATDEIVGTRNGDGRWKLEILGKWYYIHRLVWFWHHNEWPRIVDHIDRDLDNNAIENLRKATPSQSSCNRVESNASGFRGVDKYGNRWRAKIRFQNKHIHIGYFDTPEAASEAYQRKAAELHGDFAVFESK